MKSITKKQMNKYKNGQCLIDGCPTNKFYARGICLSHYGMIRRLVKLKRRTWEEFEKYGMVLPSQHGQYSLRAELFKKMWEKKTKSKL